MKRFPDLLLALMVGGIVTQLLITAGRGFGGEDQSELPEPLDVGDTLLLVAGHTGRGAPDTVLFDDGIGSVTMVYSFHPDCVHSRDLGQEWARHFDEVRAADGSVRRIAMTLDMPSSALAFVEGLGWQTELLSVAGLSPLRPEYALISRTPWIFVFDSHGVLRLHDHGSQIDQIEEAVSRLLSESAYLQPWDGPGGGYQVHPNSTHTGIHREQTKHGSFVRTISLHNPKGA